MARPQRTSGRAKSEGSPLVFRALVGFVALMARGLTYASAFFLAAMMMITVADVSLRTLFNIPIFGTFDLVEIFLVALVFLALTETFLLENHVVVELVDLIFSARKIALLRVIAGMAGLALLIGMGVNMIQPALDMIEFDERTLDLSIPKYIHWIPILLGVVCSILAIALIFVRDLLRLFKGPDGK